MRRIFKSETIPECLTKFIAEEQSIDPEPVNLTYECFNEKRELRRVLTEEQHGLCGYTGAPINDTSSLESPANKKTTFSNHIEHLKSRAVCKRELLERNLVRGRDLGDDLNYYNMIAALEVTGTNKEKFGAAFKGDGNLLIWPIHDDCDEVFLFHEADGGISGLSSDAKDSITMLYLDHYTLNSWRLSAIEVWLDPEIFVDRDSLLEVLEVMESPREGKLPDFSFVISSIIRSYLE